MKTQKILIITMLMCLVGFATACLNEDGNLTYRIKVDAKDYLQEQDSSSNYLDTIFSAKNPFIPKIYDKDRFFVINSNDELDSINFRNFDVKIDFSKYTLIGGAFWSGNNVIKISTSLDEQEKKYLLNIMNCLGNMDIMEYFYFWRLYPKLNVNKILVVEITHKNNTGGDCE